jgi:tetrahydrodipicolinate N-succinyltransferase
MAHLILTNTKTLNKILIKFLKQQEIRLQHIVRLYKNLIWISNSLRETVLMFNNKMINKFLSKYSKNFNK